MMINIGLKIHKPDFLKQKALYLTSHKFRDVWSASLVVILLFGFNYCFAEEDDTDEQLFQVQKVVNASIIKDGNVYKTAKLEVVDQVFAFKKDYKSFQGRMTNGSIVSFSNKELAYFFVGNLKSGICSDTLDESGKIRGGCKEIEKNEIQIDIPYFPNGKYADIYSPEGKKIFTIDLSSKATCNENNNCDRPLEDSINCPSDCIANEPIVDASLKKQIPVRAENITSQNNGKQPSGWWDSWGKLVLAILIVLVVGVGALVVKRRRF